ncbi:MAG: Gfo/Idh/MocA family oxidoreductase [Gemmatimonadaceae bacterium]
MSHKKSRREFVADASKLAIGAAILPMGFPTIVPRHVLGGPGYRAPSAGLNIAIVGCGGMGRTNAQALMSENLVAFCDVDMVAVTRSITTGAQPNAQGRAPGENAVKLNEAFQKANKYTDFREMLAKQPDIDAVLIATPDHTHAVIAAAAMKAGKHVYVQKPLTYSVYEARVLSKLARDNPRLVTQMGNQGHSREGTRRVVEWIRAGVIGDVKEVHIYTDRPARFWAQGLPRPAATQGQAVMGQGNIGRMNAALAQAMGNAPTTMPEGLRWDLYLGPVAEDIPYHPVYHPFTWRGWVDFGVGALGDMGAHLIDQAYWSLGLTQPTSIEATSSLWGTMSIPAPAGATVPDGRGGSRPAPATQKQVSYPMATTVHYEFPAVGNRGPVRMYWYDGGLFPPRPEGLPDYVKLDSEGGAIFIGSKGLLIHDTYGDDPRLYNAGSISNAGAVVPVTVPRVTTTHEMNWIAAIKGEAVVSAPFEYAAGLTETMCLGLAALRAGQGRKVYYDAAKMEFTNAPDANQFLTREFRAGWEI